MRNYLYFGTLLFAFLGCAEKRPTERVMDFESNRFKKATLLSSDKWMYKTTVVETSAEGGPLFVGAASDLQIGRFDFSKDRLNFYSALSPFSNKGEGTRPSLVQSFDIKHSQYRLRESSGKVTNVEEEDQKISWESKDYFKIDYTSQKVPGLSSGDSCFKKVSDTFVDGSQEFSKEHFTFAIDSVYEVQWADCISFGDLSRRQNAGIYTLTQRVKHSFAPFKESDSYKPFVYENEFDPTRKKYGYFETVVDRYNDETGRFAKSILANRWDPNKQHKIYYSGNFADKYKWIYNKCWALSKEGGEAYEACKKTDDISIQAVTNKLFKDHGLKVSFEFIDDETKEFGDVRYSFVNFVSTIEGSAPLGYGPSDVNPMTGEIIRSDSIIWTSGLNYYVDIIKREVENREKRYQGQMVSKVNEALLDTGIGPNKEDWVSSSEAFYASNLLRQQQGRRLLDEDEVQLRDRAAFEWQKMLSENIYANPYWARFTYHDPFAKVGDLKTRRIGFEGGGAVARSVGLLDKVGSDLNEASRRMLSEVEFEIERYKKGAFSHSRQKVRYPTTVFRLEDQLVNIPNLIDKGKSADEIIDTILYRVATHEFGHNLNLRHNFYGSMDVRNFADPKVQRNRDGEQIVRKDNASDDPMGPLLSSPVSSSVMDYLSIEDEYMVEHNWEPYDQAALVYAYSDGKTDLNILDLVAAASESSEAAYQKREKSRQFLYCSDEHVGIANPFCNRFDKGSTASEVVVNYIESYDRAYQFRNLPYDRAYWDTSSYNQRVVQSLLAPFSFLMLHEDINGGGYSNWLGRMTPFSDFSDDGMLTEREVIRKWVEDDVERAATLLAAFYSGILTFSSNDRELSSAFDPFTGNVRRIGITWDKVVAMYGLGGSFIEATDNGGLDYNVNFLSHLEDVGPLGTVLRKSLVNIAVENVEFPRLYFIGLGRSLYLDTSVVDQDMRDLNYSRRMMIKCYTKAALKQRFAIDADRFYPYVQGNQNLIRLDGDSEDDKVRLENNLKSLEAAVVKLGGVSKENVGASHYPVRFSSSFGKEDEIEAAIVRVNDDYYLAPQMGQKSGYAFEFFKKGIGSDNNSISPSMKRYIYQTKGMYDEVMYGDREDCIDYQEDLTE